MKAIVAVHLSSKDIHYESNVKNNINVIKVNGYFRSDFVTKKDIENIQRCNVKAFCLFYNMFPGNVTNGIYSFITTIFFVHIIENHFIGLHVTVNDVKMAEGSILVVDKAQPILFYFDEGIFDFSHTFYIR